MKLYLFVLIIALGNRECNPPEQATANEPSQTTVDSVMIEEGKWYRSQDAPVAALERTYCFGECPVFKLEIYGDGFLYYEGVQNVKSIGKFSGNISEETLQSILQTGEEIGFFSLQKLYDKEGVMDLPSAIYTLSKSGRTHTVISRYEGPESLGKLEQHLLRVLDDASLKLLN